MSEPASGPSTQRTVLITGAASGIGRATVARFAADGWNVVAADINAASNEALAAELAGAGHGERVEVVRCDVSVEADVAAAVARGVERFGALNCVVNNAGVGGAFGPIDEVEVEDWDYTFGVVTRGVFLGVKHGARALKAAGGGSIVNLGSIAGLGAGAGPQAYSAAKAAVINLGRSAAVELAPFRIRVNTVCPGFIRTPILGAGARGLEGLLGQVQPWPETGRPEDIAGVIAFLAGPDSAFITGEEITVDGGVLASGPRAGDAVGGDPASRGLVGVARGTTGQGSTVRRRLPRAPGG
jgi:NAD(P)-dependent dehydrogenase (short-subunit alcohol dehydrogenase family)